MKLHHIFNAGILAKLAPAATQQAPTPPSLLSQSLAPLVYGPEVRRASRSKYKPHVGAKQAGKRYRTREERKADAIASMNSKGLPYRLVRENTREADGFDPANFLVGYPRYEVRAFGQAAGAGFSEIA